MLSIVIAADGITVGELHGRQERLTEALGDADGVYHVAERMGIIVAQTPHTFDEFIAIEKAKADKEGANAPKL